MPSTSPKQARTMAAAAHNPKFAKKMGIPQKVGKEFNAADAGTGILKKAKQSASAPPSAPPAAPAAAPKSTAKPLPSAAPKPTAKPDYGADNRKGRLSSIDTDRGKFRFKANRKGD